ncbi:MAG: PD-(D/E)XK nuclease family protein [Gemmatimonadota bacterium]
MRGEIVHGVLERLDSVDDLSTVLDETIDSLQQPELEEMLKTGSSHREELEAEIRRIVESSEWTEYTEGELGRDFWKELTFTHLTGRRDWRFGAFDLFRPSGDRAGEAAGENLIVDFKTHQVTANQAARVAEDYRIQAEVYRAAGAIAGSAEVRLHFTRPNKVEEMAERG